MGVRNSLMVALLFQRVALWLLTMERWGGRDSWGTDWLKEKKHGTGVMGGFNSQAWEGQAELVLTFQGREPTHLTIRKAENCNLAVHKQGENQLMVSINTISLI
jgi:hypothetical protein